MFCLPSSASGVCFNETEVLVCESVGRPFCTLQAVVVKERGFLEKGFLLLFDLLV